MTGRGHVPRRRRRAGAPRDDLDERTRLAAEYAERYALDHHGLDDEFWTRMKAAYTDSEIVELSHVPRLVARRSAGSTGCSGLDAACVLPVALPADRGRPYRWLT